VQSSTKELQINLISKQGKDVMIDLGEDLEVSSASINQRWLYQSQLFTP